MTATAWLWGQVLFAGAFGAAMTLVLVQRLRRNWRLLRGQGVTVEARVTGYVEGEHGTRFPVFEFTGAAGTRHTVRGIRGSATPRAVGARRRLTYLPGGEDQAEEAGWGVPLLIDLAALVAAVGSGLFLLDLLGG